MLNIHKFAPGLGISDWMNAQSHCRANYKDLAIVNTPGDNTDLSWMVSVEPFWIGLFRDHWKWADDSPLTFENWEEQFPNTHYIDACAAVRHNGKWFNQNCEEHRPYVCYSGKFPLLLRLFHQIHRAVSHHKSVLDQIRIRIMDQNLASE